MRSSCQRASLSIPLLSGLVTASRRWTALWTIPLALSGCRLDLFFMSYFFLMSSSAGPTHPCLQVLVFYALYGTISNSTGTTFFFNNFSKHQASRIGCMVATIHRRPLRGQERHRCGGGWSLVLWARCTHIHRLGSTNEWTILSNLVSCKIFFHS